MATYHFWWLRRLSRRTHFLTLLSLVLLWALIYAARDFVPGEWEACSKPRNQGRIIIGRDIIGTGSRPLSEERTAAGPPLPFGTSTPIKLIRSPRSESPGDTCRRDSGNEEAVGGCACRGSDSSVIGTLTILSATVEVHEKLYELKTM